MSDVGIKTCIGGCGRQRYFEFETEEGLTENGYHCIWCRSKTQAKTIVALAEALEDMKETTELIAMWPFDTRRIGKEQHDAFLGQQYDWQNNIKHSRKTLTQHAEAIAQARKELTDDNVAE